MRKLTHRVLVKAIREMDRHRPRFCNCSRCVSRRGTYVLPAKPEGWVDDEEDDDDDD